MAASAAVNSDLGASKVCEHAWVKMAQGRVEAAEEEHACVGVGVGVGRGGGGRGKERIKGRAYAWVQPGRDGRAGDVAPGEAFALPIGSC